MNTGDLRYAYQRHTLALVVMRPYLLEPPSIRSELWLTDALCHTSGNMQRSLAIEPEDPRVRALCHFEVKPCAS